MICVYIFSNVVSSPSEDFSHRPTTYMSNLRFPTTSISSTLKSTPSILSCLTTDTKASRNSQQINFATSIATDHRGCVTSFTPMTIQTYCENSVLVKNSCSLEVASVNPCLEMLMTISSRCSTMWFSIIRNE